MEFRVLGTVGIADGDQMLPVGGAQPRRLLAMLLAHRNAVVGVDRLIDALWEEPADSAQATLQSYVSKLRRFVELTGEGVQLVSRAPGYVLELPDAFVDAGRFERGLADGRSLLLLDAERALGCLEAALGEWRGEAFAEFADADWIRPEAIRLDELRVTAEEARADAELRLGRHDVVIGRLEALVDVHPLRERLWSQLMLALYRSGRQPEALRRSQDFRSGMRDELGLEPSAAMRDLETAILEERADLAWVPPAVVPRADDTRARRGPARTVPEPPTPLIGREDDLELAARLFESGRLLTLFGPGGVGKTRLAYRLAGDLGDRFADGVRLIELAPLRDPVAVTAAFADALDVQQRPQRSLEDSIVELLAHQHALLVVDNCEHVLDDVSEIVARLLAWCPDLHVLATSREPLGIPAEVVWSVPPLRLPADDRDRDGPGESAAVQLFVARAAAASPDFVLDDGTVTSVVEICRRLDGLPLALELAAARMRSMSASELAERLPDRFRVLAGARRATDPRHRTLRDLVQWSYDLLGSDEQLLFERLSLFAGWFDLDRAERICGDHGIERHDVAALLATLVDKSMVTVQNLGGAARYRLLETLRDFGRELLDTRPEAELVRSEHVAVHVALTETAGAGLFGPDESHHARALDDAFDDLRDAHASALRAGDVDSALRLVVALREYAARRIRYEHVTWTEATVAAEGADAHPLWPAALGIVAYGLFVRGDLEGAVEAGLRAIEVAADHRAPTLAIAERALGNALFFLGRVDETFERMDDMITASESTEIDGIVAHAYYMRSVAETSVGNHVVGEAVASVSRASALASRSPTALAQSEYAMALAIERTDSARVLELLDAAVEHADEVGNRWIRAFALTESLWVRAELGEPESSLVAYRGVVDTWYRGGDWANQWLSLRYVFAILESLGRDEAAAVLYGALDTAGVMGALPLEPGNADKFALAVGRLAERLGASTFAECADRGRAMRDEEVVRHTLVAIEQVAEEPKADTDA